jgi:excisionase family DNA binding protein
MTSLRINRADPLRLLRAREVAELLGIHLITVYRWSREGKLPRPVKLARGHTAWRARDLEALLDRQQAANVAGGDEHAR